MKQKQVTLAISTRTRICDVVGSFRGPDNFVYFAKDGKYFKVFENGSIDKIPITIAGLTQESWIDAISAEDAGIHQTGATVS